MLQQKSRDEVLKDYLNGREALVICEYADGSKGVLTVDEMLPKEEDGYCYLADVPAIADPDEDMPEPAEKPAEAETVFPPPKHRRKKA